MSDFVGRATELKRLADRLDVVRETRRGGFIAMRGRRRVGKSRLVEQFAQQAGVPFVFFVATRQAPERELTRFADAVAASNLPAGALVRAGAAFSSWEAALTIAASDATWDQPVIVVVDELPYLVEKEPELEAVLQKVWDRTLQRAPVLLVVIGSDVATMEALAEHGRPLYDRAREMVVSPLNPADVAAMLDLEPAAALDAYLVIGGFPELAATWRRGQTMWSFLKAAVGESNSLLVVSAQRALAAEFPTDAHARSVLSAIGAGDRAFSAIQTRAGLPKTTLDRALSVLASKRVALRSTPYSARAGASNPQWAVTDPYMRFWLRFVEPNVELLERDRGELVLDTIRGAWESYRGRAIEPIVRDALERMLPDERLGAAHHVGSYWTRNHRVEVDLVGGDAMNAPANVAFVGSVKWRGSGKFDRRDLAALVAARPQVPGADETTLLVGVSRNGTNSEGLDVALDAADIVGAWSRGASL